MLPHDTLPPLPPPRPVRRRGPTPGTEAARRGGLVNKATYSREHFAAIGRLGGQQVARSHDPQYYADIGRKGGLATKRRHGTEHYRRIGQQGGQQGRRAGKGRRKEEIIDGHAPA